MNEASAAYLFQGRLSAEVGIDQRDTDHCQLFRTTDTGEELQMRIGTDVV